MKMFLVFLSTLGTLSILSLPAHAILLQCEPGEVHTYNTLIVDESSCPSGLAIRSRDVSVCVETELTDLRPGRYQICGSYTENSDAFFVRIATNARLR